MNGTTTSEAVRPPGPQAGRDLHVGLGVEETERQVLQLPLHLPDTNPVCQRGKEVHCFLGDPLLFILGQITQSPHIVKPVRKLDQYDPDIVRHGKNHLSDTFGLACLRTAAKGESTQLGYPGDDMGNFLTEHCIYFFRSGMGIFDHIVQQAGGDADHIEFHVGQNTGYFQGVGKVGLSGQTHLTIMDPG